MKVPWIRHDSDERNTPGAKSLLAQYRFEGWGRYQILLELIAEHGGLDLSTKLSRNGYAGELGLSPDEFDAFLSFLTSPDECGLLYRDGNFIRSTLVDKCAESLEKKRKSNSVSYRNHRSPIDSASESGDSDSSDSESTDSDSESTDSGAEPTTEQSCLENSKKAAAEGNVTRPVDKCPPAAFDIFGMKKELQEAGIAYSERDLVAIAHRLEALGITEGGPFAAYVIERAKRAEPENLGGYVKSALMKYDNWAAEFIAARPPPPEPKIPEPGPCLCGGDWTWEPWRPKTERKCARCGARIAYGPSGWAQAAKAAVGGN